MSARDIFINLVTKTDKKGLDDAEKGLEGLGKKSEKTGGLFQKLSGVLSGFGDKVGKDLTGKLGAAGGAIDDVGGGLGEMSGKAALAGGAVVALGGFIAGGVKKLGELYDNTRAFNEVAGTTWEEGSKLIAVFDDLRVSSEEGAGAIGKLTKTVGTSPEVLKQFGIEIAHTKDGTVDMTGTLENVATAFQQTTDPAKRAALGSALFGKSWQNIVPVLDKGGDSLKRLIDGVDSSQVATEKGAQQQDELFAATDNLHDALDGLQRQLAENLIPTLAGLAEGTAEGVGWFGKLQNQVEKLGPSFEEADKHHIDLKKTVDVFGTVADHVGQQTVSFADKLGQAADAARNAHAILDGLTGGMVNTELRAKDAAKAFGEFEKKTKDLLAAQEDMRNAQLGAIGTSQALSDALERAGDASFELTTKAKEVENAVKDYGAGSTEAAIATEEYKRAVRDAKGAVTDAADAEVAHAAKMAESRGETLTAAEQTKIYRDKLIELQAGAKDPNLINALQTYIDYLAETASQAQNAAANTHGLIQAMNDASGIERNFTGRNPDGTAVTRRASGGPVWPGRTYLVGENGPEMLRFDGTGPGEVLSNPQSAQTGDWPILSGKGKGSSPTITRDADGLLMFGGDPNYYRDRDVVGGASARAPKVAIRPLGLGDDYSSGGLSLGGSGGGVGGGVFNITVNVMNAIIGNRQELGEYLTRVLDDWSRARS